MLVRTVIFASVAAVLATQIPTLMGKRSGEMVASANFATDNAEQGRAAARWRHNAPAG